MGMTRLAIPAALTAAIGLTICGIPTASATANVAELGGTQQLQSGGVTVAYTVEELEPADDTITNAEVKGQLWEASVTVRAVDGSVTPVIPFFNTRAADGTNYRVLFTAVGEEALSGATLSQGQEAEGNVYFDVTGPAPAQVVYNDGVADLLIWQ